jgi:hypothetical protein
MLEVGSSVVDAEEEGLVTAAVNVEIVELFSAEIGPTSGRTVGGAVFCLLNCHSAAIAGKFFVFTCVGKLAAGKLSSSGASNGEVELGSTQQEAKKKDLAQVPINLPLKSKQVFRNMHTPT